MMAPGGSMYATPGKGKNEVRMAYVIESDKLERAMEILKKAIEEYNRIRAWDKSKLEVNHFPWCYCRPNEVSRQ